MSILNEVGPNSLQLLMNKTPSTLSDEEILQIIEILRKERSNFKLEPESKKKIQASPEMTLDDLGL
jgi:hypothetical protein